MNPSCKVEIKGHIIDSLTLPKVMDTILESGGKYAIEEIQIGEGKTNISYAKLEIEAGTREILDNILNKIKKCGAELIEEKNVILGECPKDKTLPDNFYSTTNLITDILLDDKWIPVEDTAMDCGIVVDAKNNRAFCRKISQIKKGDMVVVGKDGIRIHPLDKDQKEDDFKFMASDVSSEKPKSLMIKSLAKRMKEIKENNEGKILFVLGPVVVHTKSQEAFSKLIEMGYVDYLFAGNALATHDIEAVLYGTSLGVSMETGKPVPGGHSHHLRAINKINQSGSIKQAVEEGVLTSGIMYNCIKNNIDFVLAGSIRDDGPLPDVITDTVTAQCEMRKRIRDTKMAIMSASMLHSIAVGNLLPGYVETVCVDINPAVVTKLSDRGSHQTMGIVTDVESFLSTLAENLAND